jgi:PAS domain S-box-containing protein
METAFASVHPEDRERVKRKLLEAVDQLRDFHEEMRLTRADGSIAWVELLGTVHFDAARRPLGMVGVMRDVTRRKQIEESESSGNRRAPRTPTRRH